MLYEANITSSQETLSFIIISFLVPSVLIWSFEVEPLWWFTWLRGFDVSWGIISPPLFCCLRKKKGFFLWRVDNLDLQVSFRYASITLISDSPVIVYDTGGLQCLLKSRHLRMLCNRSPGEHAWASFSPPERVQLILTWQGRYHDQEGGSPIARLSHCTEAVADPCEFPKCGNLDCIISGSGGLRSRSPLVVLF